MHGGSSGLPHYRSWDRTLTLPKPSASMTMNWMSSMTLFIWAQLSQTPPHLTQSSTGASERQRRARWLVHVVRMDDGRIPKDLVFGELVQGKRPTGRPQLRFKDVCKRDLKALNIDQNNWEATALKRSACRQTVQKGLSNFEETLGQQHEEKRMRRKAAAHADRPASDFICALCHRNCHSRIGLASHTRRCTRINT